MIVAPGKARVGILISGRGSNMAALIEAARARDCPYAVVLVLSNDPDAPGLAIAHAAGVPTAARSHKGVPREAFDRWVEEELRAADVEWVALAGYMRLLSDAFVNGRAGRIVNIHPSLLPLYKGLRTHERAIANGDAEAGCSVHIVTPTLDDGPVIAQARVPIRPGDTPDTLAARVLVEEHRLYPRALADLVRPSVRPAATPPPSAPPPAAPEKRRRRWWLPLGEVLAVAGVAISGLALWNSYKERTSGEAARVAEERKETTHAATLALKASVADGGKALTLSPLNPDQTIQGQTITFPDALTLPPIETTGEGRIEARWFEDPLKRARKAAGLSEEAKGDERLPVLLTTRYVADGEPMTAIARYDIGYRLESHFLGGSAVRLRGLSLVRRVKASAAGQALKGAWPPKG